MSIEKRWQSRAWLTEREIPPKKTAKRSTHLKFSTTRSSLACEWPVEEKLTA
jgi:hypothetical protein